MIRMSWAMTDNDDEDGLGRGGQQRRGWIGADDDDKDGLGWGRQQ